MNLQCTNLDSWTHAKLRLQQEKMFFKSTSIRSPNQPRLFPNTADCVVNVYFLFGRNPGKVTPSLLLRCEWERIPLWTRKRLSSVEIVSVTTRRLQSHVMLLDLSAAHVSCWKHWCNFLQRRRQRGHPSDVALSFFILMLFLDNKFNCLFPISADGHLVFSSQSGYIQHCSGN